MYENITYVDNTAYEIEKVEKLGEVLRVTEILYEYGMRSYGGLYGMELLGNMVSISQHGDYVTITVTNEPFNTGMPVTDWHIYDQEFKSGEFERKYADEIFTACYEYSIKECGL